MILPRVFTLREYKRWLRDRRSRDASLPSFFDSGVKRTLNILRGVAFEKSVSKWRSFGSMQYAMYLKKPSYKRAIALRNWGFNVRMPKQ